MHGILHKAILIWGGSAAYHSKALISLQQDENVSRKVTSSNSWSLVYKTKDISAKQETF